jgi:hypothetical protein
MYLFLCWNWRQLIVDGDRESSDVGLVVFLHAHTCLRDESDETKKQKEQEGRDKERENRVHHWIRVRNIQFNQKMQFREIRNIKTFRGFENGFLF